MNAERDPLITHLFAQEQPLHDDFARQVALRIDRAHRRQRLRSVLLIVLVIALAAWSAAQWETALSEWRSDISLIAGDWLPQSESSDALRVLIGALAAVFALSRVPLPRFGRRR